MSNYPFEIRPLTVEEGGGFLISYPDFSDCISDGETVEEALKNGQDELTATIAALKAKTLPVPAANANQARIRDLSKDTPLTVFIANPTTSRVITNPRFDDTHEELASRQEYIDAISGFAGALARGHAARQAWTQDGTVLTAAEFSAKRGITAADLATLEHRGELFSLTIDDARWYPTELLKLSPDESAVLCRALAGDDPATQLIFLMREHGALGGQTVTAAIGTGQLARVLQLVHARQR